MYIVIEHCNGEIMDRPILVFNEYELEPYIDGEYLIYCLDYNIVNEKNYLIEYKKED